MPSFLATLSTAPEVGMLRATPLRPFLRKRWLRLANTASESLGVTKKFLPKIMLRSASPSQAAPKSNSDLTSDRQPISLTRSCAHSKFGSGCIPLKSGLGSQAFNTTFPPNSANTALAYGPDAPYSPSKTILKSFLSSSYLIALKSNNSLISCRQICTFSTTLMTKSGLLRSTLVKWYSPVEEREIWLRKLMSACEYLLILVVSLQTWLVNSSCAGPPFLPLNLMPKSSCGPPGLWLAVSSTPPMQFPSLSFNFLIQAEQAGVDINPSSAICSSSIPLAQATLQMTSMASLEKYLPSPPTSNVLCFSSASLGSALKQLWIKFSTQ